MIPFLHPDIDRDHHRFQTSCERQRNLDRDSPVGGLVRFGLVVVGVRPEGKTVFDIAPADLYPLSPAELRAKML